MTISDTGRSRRMPRPSAGETTWADWALMLAAAAGLFAGIRAWFDWRSGIQGEPGTMLVIVACGLILIGLAVTLTARSRGVLRLFQALILAAAVLTALAAWFLMAWVVMGAMIVASLVQIARLILVPR